MTLIFVTFRLDVINETPESLIFYYYGCALSFVDEIIDNLNDMIA
jgi:hypothetical protein